jgi:hypothetical protein
LSTGLRAVADWQQTSQARRRITKLASTGPERPIGDLISHYKRSSDIVFILGSGGSIAQIGDNGWSQIRRHDSIGFNFWMIHPHRPNLYFIEGTRYLETYHTLIKWLHKRESDYRGIPFVIEYKLWSYWGCRLEDLPEGMRFNTYLNAPLMRPTYDENRMRQYLRSWCALGANRANQLVNMIHHRASISALIAAAYCLGYKEIVLVGVDLKNTRYFWEELHDLEGPFPPNIETGDMHATVIQKAERPTYGLPIDLYLRLFDDEILKPSGRRLYNASPISSLNSVLPYYALEEDRLGPV